ncbi:ABC transporter [Sphingobium sp. KCTC 72723]|uniref:ABC transporter n=1 Tax=Sphingobium sp. KCTC 72723 TaxID=2733867 RepID=UPI00165E6610|nr:ABC transporter [Sphingobium sp. KCTC 72723]
MRRRLLLFLVLMLPVVAALLAGIARAWRSGGQADPWSWALPAALVLALMGRILARSAGVLIVWIAVGVVGAILVFCAIAAGRWPDPLAAIGLALATPLAGIASMLLYDRQKRLLGAGLLALAALVIWRGPAQEIAPVADRPALAVMTALPLFWDEKGQGKQADAPIVTLLRTRFTIMPVDDARALAASGAGRLLLAQPRAMTPEQLVAVDRWVRDGGRAVVLADPLWRWPSALPLGDRRRAPSVSLLGPLLAHWGVVQGRMVAGETRHFLPDDTLVTLSDFARLGGCRGDGVMVTCAIGRGQAVVVGDADLIDDRLWLANPATPRDPRAWSADTPALVARWLGASIPGDRRWMRDQADVVLGLRWALILGTIWAVLGSLFLARHGQRDRQCNAKEQKMNIGWNRD